MMCAEDCPYIGQDQHLNCHRSWWIAWCFASSVKNATSSSGDILGLVAVPCVAPIRSAAVIVCMADLYNGGKDDMRMVVNLFGEMVEPMSTRLS